MKTKPYSLGIVGGGQLGRMISFAARRMGHSVLVLDPDPNCPSKGIADLYVGDYDDFTAMKEFSKLCDVVTIEFENLSVPALRQCDCPVHPSPDVLSICQDRILEKTFLRNCDIPVTQFYPVRCLLFTISDRETVLESKNDLLTKKSELLVAIRKWIENELFGLDKVVIKSSRMGYDGKSQQLFQSFSELEQFILSEKFDASQEWILESFVPFTRELSLIVARSQSGEFRNYPLVENTHKNHILDTTIAPAPNTTSNEIHQAISIAKTIVESLEFIGTLCIELFELPSGKLLVNELAPRPHNSGHWTIEGAQCSQFEQTVRAVKNLPLGLSEPIHDLCVMKNLLGDLWTLGEPNWNLVLEVPGVNLHLYQKNSARIGRKMGHLTALGSDSFNRVMKAYHTIE